MTRKSKRELENALDDLADDLAVAEEPCPECGGAPEGFDAAEGVTAPFVTYECACDREDADGSDVIISWKQPDDWEPDDDDIVIDLDGADT
jgi:hypothetical protein